MSVITELIRWTRPRAALCIALLVLMAAGMVSCRASGRPTATPPSLTVQPQQTLAAQQAPGTSRAPIDQPATTAPTATPFYVSRVESPPGTLVYPLDASPAGFDPQEDDDEASGVVLAQVFEAPFNLRGDGRLEPAAATGYAASPDLKTYTVTLRAEAAWPDGRPVTAQDFVAGVCHALDPGVGSRFGYLLTEAAGVTGAADYASGAAPDCSRVGVSAVDAMTLRISLERPSAGFPQFLATRAFWPAVPRSTAGGSNVAPATAARPAPTLPVIAAATRSGPVSTRAEATGQPAAAGNGPYVVAEWQTGSHVTLVRNERYWDAAAVNIARIEMPVLAGADAQWDAYRAGNLHVAAASNEIAARGQADPVLGRELHVLAQPGTSFLGFNTAITPTANLAVRRAIAAAIDRRALIQDVLHEPWHVAAARLLPPGLPGFEEGAADAQLAFDPQAAPQLLTQAGYSPANPPPPVNLWANREGQNAALATAIADMLERAGIPTRLVLSNWDVYHASLEACAGAGQAGDCGYNLYLAGWLMDYGDPARFLGEAMGAQPATGYTGWQSPAYDQLLARAAGEPGAAERAGLYRQAESLLLDEVVVAPLFFYDRALLVKPGVTFEYPPFGAPLLRFWRK